MVLVEPKQVGDRFTWNPFTYPHKQTQGKFIAVGPCLGVFSELESGRRVWDR